MARLSVIAMCAGVAACGHRNSVVGAAPIPVPAVQVAQDCRELARKVDEPVWTRGKRAKVLLAETTSALVQANQTIEATGHCQDKLYEALGTPYDSIAAK